MNYQTTTQHQSYGKQQAPLFIFLSYLLKRKEEEFFCAHYFLEILKGELMRSFVKLFTSVGICEVSDAKTVCGMELAHEELAAGLPHGHDLQDGGGGEKDLSSSIWK